MNKFIILDRDGVINEDSDNYIKSTDEWIPIAGSIEAINRLKKAGYRVAVATNQSGLARGFFDLKELQAMHDKMDRLLAQRGASVDGVFFCPHSPNDNCPCRKPKPGLLLQIAEQFSIDLKQTYFVGDSMVDIQAAKMAGARPVLVQTGKGLTTMAKLSGYENIPVYDNLSHFVRELLMNHAG